MTSLRAQVRFWNKHQNGRIQWHLPGTGSRRSLARKSAHIIFLSLFRLLFLKNFGFLQVTKDKFCRPERKQCRHRQVLDTSCRGTYSQYRWFGYRWHAAWRAARPSLPRADLFTGSSRVPDEGGALRDEPKDRLLGRPMGWRLLFSFSEFRIQRIQRL